MTKVFEHFPELEGEEMRYISKAIEGLDEENFRLFKSMYKARRKDPLLILLLSAVGLFGIAGIHRFFMGHVGMGILYFLTAGLCFIGTIVDMINYKNFGFEYNRKQALDILEQLK
ncbi:MAG: TM2 domain-containing protein [Balneolaceae bacterium]